jgi:hypothetical protein
MEHRERLIKLSKPVSKNAKLIEHNGTRTLLIVEGVLMGNTEYKKTPMGKYYLTPKELSERWGVAEQTLANWRHEGKGPRFYRGAVPGVRVVYYLSSIESYERKMENEAGK